jgi:hypothetical protein
MSLLTVAGLYFGGVTVLGVLSHRIVREADGDRTARALPDGRLEFAPDPQAILAMYIFIGIFAAFGTWGLIFALVEGGGLALAMFCLLLVLLLLRLLPGTIVLSEQGLEQKYWLAKVTHIGWDDVQSVSVNEKQNRTTVYGRQGAKIKHERQLPDRARLLAALEARCPDKMPGATPASVAPPA